MSIEAMKQSLKAMQNAKGKIYSDFAAYKEVESAIKVLEGAIEEAEKQEPVAEVEADGVMRFKPTSRKYKVGDKIYLHPQPKREWVSLTGEELDRVIEKHAGGSDWSDDEYDSAVSFARDYEDKLKEKNT